METQINILLKINLILYYTLKSIHPDQEITFVPAVTEGLLNRASDPRWSEVQLQVSTLTKTPGKSRETKAMQNDGANPDSLLR